MLVRLQIFPTRPKCNTRLMAPIWAHNSSGKQDAPCTTMAHEQCCQLVKNNFFLFVFWNLIKYFCFDKYYSYYKHLSQIDYLCYVKLVHSFLYQVLQKSNDLVYCKINTHSNIHTKRVSGHMLRGLTNQWRLVCIINTRVTIIDVYRPKLTFNYTH